MGALDRLWREQPVLRRAWLALGLYNMALGTLLMVGGVERVSTDTFALVRAVGGPTFWGLMFAVGGLSILVSAYAGERGIAIVCACMAIVHVWFATQFIVAASLSTTAAVTGPPTYMIVAWWHLSVAIAYWAGSQSSRMR